MKKMAFLTLALILGSNCAGPGNSQANHLEINQSSQTPENAKAIPAEDRNTISSDFELKKDVPLEFREIDFRNFSYPISARNKLIRLKDGEYEYEDDKKLGNGWFNFDDVDYADLTGDGKKEAVVRLNWVACGGSCDGGSTLFYFYFIRQGKLILLSQIEMGSLGYACGLKSFTLSNTDLTLETFRSCRYNGLSFRGAYDADETGGKFLTNRFTQFILRFNGRRFVLRKRKVFPYPEDDFRGYEPKISISND